MNSMKFGRMLIASIWIIEFCLINIPSAHTTETTEVLGFETIEVKSFRLGGDIIGSKDIYAFEPSDNLKPPGVTVRYLRTSKENRKIFKVEVDKTQIDSLQNTKFIIAKNGKAYSASFVFLQYLNTGAGGQNQKPKMYGYIKCHAVELKSIASIGKGPPYLFNVKYEVTAAEGSGVVQK